MRAFAEIATRARREWGRRGFDERSFPDVAVATLRESDLCSSLRHDDVVDALVFSGDLPRQISLQEFSQPPITVFAEERFMIEVLCWMDATTAIHQHAFSGAFLVLEGSSLLSTYRFDTRLRVDSQMRIGTLALTGSELLTRGSVRPIGAGAETIHALFHLDRPSITVVLRTIEERDALPLWSYERPHLALDTRHPRAAERRRLQQLLDVRLERDTDDYRQFVLRIAREADPSLSYAALLHAVTVSARARPKVGPEIVDALHETLCARFGELADELLATCRESLHTERLAAMREEVRDVDHRFLLALLLNLPTKDAILAAIERRHEDPPISRLRRWLRELTKAENGAVELLDIEIGEEEGEPRDGIDAADLLHRTIDAMLDGRTGADLVAALRAAGSPGDPDAMASCALELEVALRRSSLRALFAG